MNDNTARQVKRYPGNKYKSFRSLAEAQEWIKPPRPGTPSPHIRVRYLMGPLEPIIPPDHDDRPVPTTSNPPAPVPSEPPTPIKEPPVTEEPGVALSPEQTHVLNIVKSGGNVFFTGSAGRFHDNIERIQ